jgi:DNA invertase Pin-like site-specific DNA recombinase
MRIGYARVSTAEQNLHLQIDALKQIGCEKIYEEKVSSTKAERIQLIQALEYAREGDVIVVWKLDRLSRSLQNLLEIVSKLEKRGIGLKSLHENIDTTTPTGKLIFHIFGALAEFEKDVIKERTKAGLVAARARGRVGGRPVKLNAKQIKQMKALYDDGTTSINEIVSLFNISKWTLYNYLKQFKTVNTAINTIQE